ncbi:MAG TPA: phenylalanine--tRNA ligase beta subunit-related protein [Trebonia sp.]|jgi:DNA/RNA-binding domain of Phe-tRNA-synthetase-like protein|nr:phenylalanine--tRNA ligase beta subunit-related protein [Trebonia sp.]
MSRITLTPQVAQAFPEAEIRLVCALGLDNASPWAEAAGIRALAEESVAAGRAGAFGEDSDHIASWHEAYRAFGTNPRRTRPSVDALLRRVRKSGALPSISPAVDSYNAVSVLSGLPAGAFDLDRVAGDIEIRFARDGDMFEPLGEPGEWESARPGEVIYADAQTVLTRHWNHRDCHQTMLRADSRNALFMLERASGKVPLDQLDQAAARLAGLVAGHCARVEARALSRDRPQAALPAR